MGITLFPNVCLFGFFPLLSIARSSSTFCFIFLLIFALVLLSAFLSFYQAMYGRLSVTIAKSGSNSFCPPVPHSVCDHHSVRQSLTLSAVPSLCPSVRPSLCPSVFLLDISLSPAVLAVFCLFSPSPYFPLLRPFVSVKLS